MKKQIISALLIFSSFLGLAQNWSTGTNIYNTNSGYIGINNGSAFTPLSKLHLVSSIARESFRIYLSTSTSNYLNIWQGSGAAALDPIGTGKLYLGYDLATDVYIGGNGYSGKLGIGTASPLAYLHVKTPNNSGNGFTIDHSYTSPYSYAQLVNVNHDQTKAIIVQRMNGATGTEVFKVWGNGTVNMKSVYAEAITVTPTSLSSWPDYVFKKEYKLMSISDLEKYIKENNHLPNVPSAEEISKDGMNVYDVNKALLEKLEEMSLYIIALKKELDEIKQKLK
jgi:hypothetical protein